MSRNRKENQGSKEVISTSKDTDWFAKLNAGPLTEKTNEEFLIWLEQHPEHEQEYERCELAWDMVGELEQDPEIIACIKECEDQIEAYRNRSNRWTDLIASVREMMAGPVAKTAAFAFCCVVAVSLVLLQLPQTYETGIGEQRLITLADGSRVTLNTDTRIAVRYSSGHRGIELERGEAIFDVEHEPDRPFEVVAGNGLARAIGTRYNVARAGEIVTVSVLEGIVEVQANVSEHRELPQGVANLEQKNAPVILKQGQAVNYWEVGAMDKPQSANLKRINAWLEGKLDFDAELLSEVIEEHNRYSSQKIVISHDQLKSLLVSGVFNAGDTEALMFALSETFGIRALHRGGLIMLVPKT